MLIRIAWRNIWRNRLRSLVVIISIVLGLWAGLFVLAFSWGMYEQRIDQAIRTEVSHIQVHHPVFREKDFDIRYGIPASDSILEQIRNIPAVEAATGRMIVTGMVASASYSGGVRLVGVDPEMEKEVTDLHAHLVEGLWFEGAKRNPVLIGSSLAEKYKVKLNSKIVVTFQDAENEMISAAFRVVGIYKTLNAKYDEMNAFVRQEDLQRLLEEKVVHQLAVRLTSNNDLDMVKDLLTAMLPTLKVEDWGDVMPEMRLAVESFDQMMMVIIFIIMLALAFGIVNTMLMAVLERTREIGMLMAVGMSKGRVFKMIMYETVMLAMIGAPTGLLLGALTIGYLGKSGIDLKMYGSGMEQFGFSAMVYPSLETDYYIKIAVLVLVIVLVAALIPSRRAIRLKPVEALRTV